ncbi:transmembrane protein 216 isoform X2 [Apodemus sylvaticus]|uniref:transmembrane protein 216 isoform X2 n=1 Tax=Apodemus sylvaticus TaxID=10129 RepID=UPI002241FEE3|nr:transmembrane protein 216 isoform X2 [Apodemus sylvaticus]
MALRDKRLSSTPLEVLFFLNGWYYATYFLLELLIFLYKGLLLPYPKANLVLDVVMLLLYLGIEVIRLFFVWTGSEVQEFWLVVHQGDNTYPSDLGKVCVVFPQHRHLDIEHIPEASGTTFKAGSSAGDSFLLF